MVLVSQLFASGTGPEHALALCSPRLGFLLRELPTAAYCQPLRVYPTTEHCKGTQLLIRGRMKD